jgi:AcrR family transcriptional regulator
MSAGASIRQQDIVAAAARLFREKGYAATTMRELAQAVGLEASSLYNHIASKADLLDRICFTAAAEFLDGMAEVEASCADPLERIRALIRLHVRIALEDPGSQTVFNDEWRHLPAERLQEFLALRRAYEQRFLHILDQAAAAGQLRDIAPRTLLRTLLSGLRWLYHDRHPGDGQPAPRLADDLCTLFLDGIRRPA